MLTFALDPSVREVRPEVVDPARLIQLIGDPAFAGAVLHQFGATLEASHCSILTLDADSQTCRIEAASFEGEGARRAGAAYVGQGFFTHDKALADPRLPNVLGLLYVLTRDDVLSAEHRRLCYDELDIRERCSIVARLPDGATVSANFYRCSSRGRFSDRDFNSANAQSPLLLAALAKHHQFVTANSQRPAPVAEPVSLLTSREREVVERCARGSSAKEIARHLGIAVTTVNTLKQRAYQRLGVRRQSELIALLSGTRHYS
ncbi:response regulator transcription factor [Paraburkholderia caffeinilytica]|uniref:helix-turn-helix transcriptional regulator n=1 Tax=Paraburkholderia caffeinilytica TaxID=1761016 RepID=UPI003DA1686F